MSTETPRLITDHAFVPGHAANGTMCAAMIHDAASFVGKRMCGAPLEAHQHGLLGTDCTCAARGSSSVKHHLSTCPVWTRWRTDDPEHSSPTSPEQAMARLVEVSHRLPTLYALTAEWAAIVSQLDDLDLYDQTALDAQLDQVSGDIRHKADQLAGLLRWYEQLAEGRRAEAQRMAASADTFSRRANGLRDYLLRNMQAVNAQRIDTDHFTLSVRQNPPSVQITDAALVPSEFQRTTVKVDPDKIAIRKHVEATGEVVPGCVVTRSERLDVR